MENLSMLSARGYSFSDIYFALDRDFSMEEVVIGAQYATIGSKEIPFAGVFDGRGHTISGYTLEDGGNRVDLFRVVTGTVKNLNLSGSVKAIKSADVGGIVGKNCGTLRNCAFSGTVSCSGGSSDVGGIAAFLYGGTIENCYVNLSSFRGREVMGGIISITGGYVKATGGVYSDTLQAAPGIGSGRPRINGSQPLSPGKVSITGGIVIATAGVVPKDGKPAMAIGVNLTDKDKLTEDSLTLGDHLRVTAGDNADNAAISLFADRVNACRSRYARVEACTKHTPDPSQSDSCKFCGHELSQVYTLGDVDGDGIVNINDVTAIQRHLAELEHLEGVYLHLADTNQSGDLDISDATTLQKYHAEYDIPYPIGEVMAS